MQRLLFRLFLFYICFVTVVFDEIYVPALYHVTVFSLNVPVIFTVISNKRLSPTMAVEQYVCKPLTIFGVTTLKSN